MKSLSNSFQGLVAAIDSLAALEVRACSAADAWAALTDSSRRSHSDELRLALDALEKSTCDNDLRKVQPHLLQQRDANQRTQAMGNEQLAELSKKLKQTQ